jgi:hypothetical protein
MKKVFVYTGPNTSLSFDGKGTHVEPNGTLYVTCSENKSSTVVATFGAGFWVSAVVREVPEEPKLTPTKHAFVSKLTAPKGNTSVKNCPDNFREFVIPYEIHKCNQGNYGVYFNQDALMVDSRLAPEFFTNVFNTLCKLNNK